MHRRPRPRLHPQVYRGLGRWFLTLSCAERRPEFVEAGVVADVTRHFLATGEATGCAILVYCFMPDHVHVVAEGCSDTADAARFVSAAKQRSGYEFSRRFGRRLWQESWYDRVLRRDDDLRDVVRYVIGNPIRAGLVEEPSQYQFT